jgi:hypothetical protein
MWDGIDDTKIELDFVSLEESFSIKTA